MRKTTIWKSVRESCQQKSKADANSAAFPYQIFLMKSGKFAASERENSQVVLYSKRSTMLLVLSSQSETISKLNSLPNSDMHETNLQFKLKA
ncbi:CLUMA_CG008082, isoform A [Clunio marinus]|uniref:CLUMA_CG008082, isoform A n=1 Tax=Clunio marinus TaxID=568069 RepID=A0A1J1I6L3_9DIPT|nr:CLUMA_CG008082, isoform A [Clunio marinus]